MGNAKILKQIGFTSIVFVWFGSVFASEQLQSGEKIASVKKDSDIKLLHSNFNFIQGSRHESAILQSCKNICLRLEQNKTLLEQVCGNQEEMYPLMRAFKLCVHCPKILAKVVKIEDSACTDKCISVDLQKQRFSCVIKRAVDEENVPAVETLLSVHCGKEVVESDAKLLNSLVLRCARDLNQKTPLTLVFEELAKLPARAKATRVLWGLGLVPDSWVASKKISPRAEIASLLLHSRAPGLLAAETARATCCTCCSCNIIRQGKEGFSESRSLSSDMTIMTDDKNNVILTWDEEESSSRSCSSSSLSSSCTAPLSPSLMNVESNYFAGSPSTLSIFSSSPSSSSSSCSSIASSSSLSSQENQ